MRGACRWICDHISLSFFSFLLWTIDYCYWEFFLLLYLLMSMQTVAHNCLIVTQFLLLPFPSLNCILFFCSFCVFLQVFCFRNECFWMRIIDKYILVKDFILLDAMKLILSNKIKSCKKRASHKMMSSARARCNISLHQKKYLRLNPTPHKLA